MELNTIFPFWSKLSPAHQERLMAAATERSIPAGTLLHNGSNDCIGLLGVKQGQLRVYTTSDEGKELTLYRLFERDMCLFSASCMLKSIQFDVMVATEQDSVLIHIPAEVYQSLMAESLPVSNYTNELMATRFSDVMWLMDQVMNKKMNARVAALLLEEAELADTTELHLTHDQLARHLGTAREVVTRMLKYFQSEGLLQLTRGSILLLEPDTLRESAADSLR